MVMYRVLPSINPQYQNMTINGRVYHAVPGNGNSDPPGRLDVPDFDMPELRANGWIVVGAYYDRFVDAPTNLPTGTQILENDDGNVVFWDGRNWWTAYGNTP